MPKHKNNFLADYLKTVHKKGLFLSMATFTVALAITLVAVDSLSNTSKPSAKELKASFYNSLDISQASTAQYVDSAITRVKDIGTTSNVRHYVFSFGVPKDNLLEYGLLTLPSSAKPKDGYPVIILCHGYANPQNYSTTSAYIDDMDFYSQHGFAVLKPDFRGQGLSLPAGVATGAFYSMDYNTDVMSLTAAIKSTSYLNGDDVSLWGHSMGAYVALRAAVIYPNYKAVVLLSGPVGQLAEMYDGYVATSDQFNDAAADNKANQIDAHGTPLSNPSYWNKVSPLNYISQSRAYFQIHAGNDDTIEPPKFSAELDQALTRLHKKHGYFIYAGGQHGLVAERPIIWQRSLKLFESK